MKKNVGAFDGMIRTLLFVIILCYAVLAGTITAWVWVIPAAVLFATAVLFWCPLFALFGWSSDGENMDGGQ